MPLPPPPATALTTTGKPCSAPIARSPARPRHDRARRRAARRRPWPRALSPISSIASGGGPIQVSPASTHGARERRVLARGSRSPGGRRRRPAARPRASSALGVEVGGDRDRTPRRRRRRGGGVGVGRGERRRRSRSPSACAVRATRTAISPRLAIRTGLSSCVPVDRPGDRACASRAGGRARSRARARRPRAAASRSIAGLDAHLVQHRDEVLGGDVAGRARAAPGSRRARRSSTRTTRSRPRSAASTLARPWPRVLWKCAVSSTSSPSARARARRRSARTCTGLAMPVVSPKPISCAPAATSRSRDRRRRARAARGPRRGSRRRREMTPSQRRPASRARGRARAPGRSATPRSSG